MTWRAYSAALVTLAVLDGLWLGVVARPFYQREMGDMMTDQVRWGAVVAFYLLYPLGVLFFAALPGSSTLAQAALRGVALGLLVYGVYDLTNMATLRHWSWSMAAADVIWGALVTGATATAAAWALRAAD